MGIFLASNEVSSEQPQSQTYGQYAGWQTNPTQKLGAGNLTSGRQCRHSDDDCASCMREGCCGPEQNGVTKLTMRTHQISACQGLVMAWCQCMQASQQECSHQSEWRKGRAGGGC